MIENLYLSERRRQRLVVGALVVLLVGGGAMSRNQREMFSAVGSEAQAATAFAAIAPPLTLGRVVGNPTALFNAARLRLPRRPLASIIPATEAEAREPDLGAAVGPAEANFLAEPTLSEPLGFAQAPELAFLEDPLEFVPVPIAGIIGEFIAPPQPLATSPVPEPSVWAMLILGFLGIGIFMRRARAREAAPALQR